MLFIIIDILHWGNWVRPFMLNGSNKRYERKKNLTCPWGINCSWNCIKLSVLFEVPSLNSDVFSFAALTFCAFVSDSFKYSKNQNSLPLFSVSFSGGEKWHTSLVELWYNNSWITHWNRSGGNSRSKMVIMPQKLLLWMRNLLQVARKRLMEKSDDTDGFNRIGSQGDAN